MVDGKLVISSWASALDGRQVTFLVVVAGIIATTTGGFISLHHALLHHHNWRELYTHTHTQYLRENRKTKFESRARGYSIRSVKSFFRRVLRRRRRRICRESGTRTFVYYKYKCARPSTSGRQNWFPRHTQWAPATAAPHHRSRQRRTHTERPAKLCTAAARARHLRRSPENNPVTVTTLNGSRPRAPRSFIPI